MTTNDNEPKRKLIPIWNDHEFGYMLATPYEDHLCAMANNAMVAAVEFLSRKVRQAANACERFVTSAHWVKVEATEYTEPFALYLDLRNGVSFSAGEGAMGLIWSYNVMERIPQRDSNLVVKRRLGPGFFLRRPTYGTHTQIWPL